MPAVPKSTRPIPLSIWHFASCTLYVFAVIRLHVSPAPSLPSLPHYLITSLLRFFLTSRLALRVSLLFSGPLRRHRRYKLLQRNRHTPHFPRPRIPHNHPQRPRVRTNHQRLLHLIPMLHRRLIVLLGQIQLVAQRFRRYHRISCSQLQVHRVQAPRMPPLLLREPQRLHLHQHVQIQLARRQIDRLHSRLQPDPARVHRTPHRRLQRRPRRIRSARRTRHRKISLPVMQRHARFLYAQFQLVKLPVPVPVIRIESQFIGVPRLRQRGPNRSLNIIVIDERAPARPLRQQSHRPLLFRAREIRKRRSIRTSRVRHAGIKIARQNQSARIHRINRHVRLAHHPSHLCHPPRKILRLRIHRRIVAARKRDAHRKASRYPDQILPPGDSRHVIRHRLQRLRRNLHALQVRQIAQRTCHLVHHVRQPPRALWIRNPHIRRRNIPLVRVRLQQRYRRPQPLHRRQQRFRVLRKFVDHRQPPRQQIHGNVVLRFQLPQEPQNFRLRINLIFYRSVQRIEQNHRHAAWSLFRTRAVLKHVPRQSGLYAARWRGVPLPLQICFGGKKRNALRLSVIQQLKIFRLQPANRFALLVFNHHADLHQPRSHPHHRRGIPRLPALRPATPAYTGAHSRRQQHPNPYSPSSQHSKILLATRNLVSLVPNPVPSLVKTRPNPSRNLSAKPGSSRVCVLIFR